MASLSSLGLSIETDIFFVKRIPFRNHNFIIKRKPLDRDERLKILLQKKKFCRLEFSDNWSYRQLHIRHEKQVDRY